MWFYNLIVAFVFYIIFFVLFVIGIMIFDMSAYEENFVANGVLLMTTVSILPFLYIILHKRLLSIGYTIKKSQIITSSFLIFSFPYTICINLDLVKHSEMNILGWAYFLIILLFSLYVLFAKQSEYRFESEANCSNCGNRNEDIANYCIKCGLELKGKMQEM